MPDEIKDAVAALEQREAEEKEQEAQEDDEEARRIEVDREVERIKSEVQDLVGKRKAEEPVPVDELVISKKARVEDVEEDEDEEDDEEFEEEDEEVREKTLVKDSQLGALRIVSKNHQKENGKIKTRLQVQFVVSNAGGVILSVGEVKKDGSLSEASTFSIPALH